MNNSLKIITDKEEYVCRGTEQTIILENIDELNARDIYLSNNSVDKYPIKSINNKTYVINTESMQNGTNNNFRFFARIDLPRLIIEDLPDTLVMDEEYVVKFLKDNWWNSDYYIGDMNIYIYIGENEEMYTTISLYVASIEETDDYISAKFKIPKSFVQTNKHTVSVKICQQKDGQMNYLCETEPKTYDILPPILAEDEEYKAIYFETSEYTFEANRTYDIKLKSNIMLEGFKAVITFDYIIAAGSSSSRKVTATIDNNVVSFQMPVLPNYNINYRSTFLVQIYDNKEVVTYNRAFYLYGE